MINNIVIICNVVTLFLFSLFSGDGGVTVNGNFPSSLKPGQSVVAELKVAKGTSAGFAKLQMDLPEGLSITEVDNMGASFTMVDGIAKWVWSSLPSSAELVVKFNLVASADASGAKTLAAKYSFVEGANKQVVEMTPVELMIGDAVATNSTAASTGSNNANPSSNETSANTSTTNSGGAANPSSNAEPSAKIAVERIISKGSNDNEQIITLKINKGNTKGFGRYSDDLPSGFTAKAVTTDGASFSTADEKIKFVWVTVPEKEILSISYAITSSSSIRLTTKGEYAYLEENQSKKFLLTEETIAFVGPQNMNGAVASNTTTETKTTATPTESVASTTTEKVAEPNNGNNNAGSSGTSNNQSANNSSETESIAKPTNTNANIDYRVQIGAFSNSEVSASKLARVFNINDKISSEMQGGFSKFMIGNYPEYKSARDKRESAMNKGVNGAFVVAYNSGKRITVQEALMLSNQKWLK